MPRGSSFPISNAASVSMHRRSGHRWSPPSAVPTPMAPGTGRPPTMPARRRPSCSCASSVPPCARGLPLPPPCCRCWPRSRAFFPPTRAAPRRARRFSSSRRRSPSASRPAPPPRSRPPISCWNLRPEPGCSPFSPNSPAGRSFSTSWPRRAPGCWVICSPVSPSPASTPRTSTIISTPASFQASCS